MGNLYSKRIIFTFNFKLNFDALSLLIAYTSSGEETWKGIFYAAVLFLSAFISTMITNQYTYRMFLIAMRVRTALVSAIYKKALLVSNSAKRGES